MRRFPKYILLFILIVSSVSAGAQNRWIVMKGKVLDGREAVSYASLQLQGTSVGTACNDAGEYELKVPTGSEGDTVIVRSVGYMPKRIAVESLQKDGTVRLVKQSVSLREVKVSSFRSPRHLINEAVRRIDSNYHQQTSWSTFFLRDWRSLDGELFLFDEAVVLMRRAAYSRYAKKDAYLFNTAQREMATNYKSMLRHRLLVYDIGMLYKRLDDPDGVDLMMEYADNEAFYDPVSAPQASFALSHTTLQQHRFEPIQEFVDDDEVFYRLEALGKGRIVKVPVKYTYIIRKRDLAIVSITAAQQKVHMSTPLESWINHDYGWMEMVQDSSVWNYDVRDGAYTLTHYYNARTIDLGTGSRWSFTLGQRWQTCVEWTMTDFSTEPVQIEGEVIEVKPQTVAGAFGISDYSSDFWGHYNSVSIDTMPLRMLDEKLRKMK